MILDSVETLAHTLATRWPTPDTAMHHSNMPDIASRVYNHNFKLDPIVRSLLDTDVYKLLMLQTIWKERADVPVTFSLINRTTSVLLADEIDEQELRAQLDHARSVKLSKKELIWLTGNTFYGRERLFTGEFIDWLKRYRLPAYELRVEDGQYRIDFEGAWAEVTLWEIPVLSIISELRSRAATHGVGRFELDVTYARAKAKLWEKVMRLGELPELRIADFGTRRRHSFLWQRWCIAAMAEGLQKKFVGTSNVLMAMDLDLDAIGTNAHELPMVKQPSPRTMPISCKRPIGCSTAGAGLTRQLADRATGHLRDDAFPRRCAGLGGRVERLPPSIPRSPSLAARS